MLGFEGKVLADWCSGQWQGGCPKLIKKFCHDSRLVEPGDMFVAIAGERVDGHQYIATAEERGAVGALVRRNYVPAAGVKLPLLYVADPKKAVWSMAVNYRQTLSCRLVAITGSIGKTTVKEMIAAVLSRGGLTGRTKGNWNNDLGLPLSVLTLDGMARFGVFEVGTNHPGELAPLCDLLRPHIGVVTNVESVHLENFNSLAAIADEKATVLRSLPADGIGFVDKDGPFGGYLGKQCRGRVMTVTMQPGIDADFVGQLIGCDGDLLVREKATGAEVKCHLPLPGEHVRRNALLAVAVGRSLGISGADIAAALAAYRAPAMRWQEVALGGVQFINDAYNAHPVSMRAALQTFDRLPCSGRKWLVLGSMRELGPSERDDHLGLGSDVARGSWAGFLAVGDLAQLIALGAEQAGLEKEKIYCCHNTAEAVRLLQANVQAGDTVLLKASRREKLEEILHCWPESFSG